MDKRAILLKFLVYTIIGLIVSIAVISVGCSLVPLGTDKRTEELSKVGSAIDMIKSGDKLAKPVVVKLEEDAAFYIIEAGEDEMNIFDNKGVRYTIRRDGYCSTEKACICYCDRMIKKDDFSLRCRTGKIECFSEKVSFKLPETADEMFGDLKESDAIYEGGVLFTRIIDVGRALTYGQNDIVFQKSGSSIMVCMKGGLCEELFTSSPTTTTTI